MWNQRLDGVCVYEFPQAASMIIRDNARDQDLSALIDEIATEMSIADKWRSDKSTDAKKPRKHQYEALEAWVQNGRRGILEHATGSGKTYTAMCAIRNCLEKHFSVIVLVPSIDLLSQWQKEMKDNIVGIDISYLFCGGSNGYWKQPGVLYSWTQESDTTYKVVISTMDTASSDYFIRNIAQGEHLLIVADEVHRLGSPKRRKIFETYCGARLGLSATPRRYGDPEGTNAIMDYFCDNQTQLSIVLQALLNNGFDAYEYHSDMEGDRSQTLSYFSINGGILVSIRCLDEGVDIPSTTHALILASSKNPREFIQRRGRILRKYPGKHFAYLYDAIVVPRSTHDPNDKSISIIEAELARAIQFGEWAENYACITDLKNIAVDNGINLTDVINGGVEDGEE